MYWRPESGRAGDIGLCVLFSTEAPTPTTKLVVLLPVRNEVQVMTQQDFGCTEHDRC